MKTKNIIYCLNELNNTLKNHLDEMPEIDKRPIYNAIKRANEELTALSHEKPEALRPVHKCECLLRACMGEGRDWWVGVLTEKVKGYPEETHCLHLKTALKNVVFLCNKADFEQLLVLCRKVTGEVNEAWIKAMLNFLPDKTRKVT